MKFCVVVFLFITNSCFSQWQAEVMVGASGYTGDLTQKAVSFKSMGPAVNLNLKYDLGNSLIVRAGLGWGKISADDKDNKNAYLKERNLNFKSNILEGSLCVEFDILEPEIFNAYPYIFAGIGLFHFNPYTYDNNNVKTYLHPLSTEGQGLSKYPDKKKYSLTQFCLPFGAGWKVRLNDQWDIIYEFGYRLQFTDYLDDVSTTYAEYKILYEKKGPKAAELSYRPILSAGTIPAYPSAGEQRGNPKEKDGYFFTGIKLLIHLGQYQN
jgi:hypothetical protein